MSAYNLFSPSEFDDICAYFYQLSGNQLSAEKYTLVDSRLRRRIVELGIGPQEYLAKIKVDDEERDIFISALTTHKTDWFREPRHFEFIKRHVIEQRKNRSGQPLLIWSAASSSGEEVYSTAITLLEAGESNFRILGSDLSATHVEMGFQGIYSKDQIEKQVDPLLIQKYFLKGTKQNSGNYKVIDPILGKTKWKECNLLTLDLNTSIQFDIILLRNVLIYFNSEDVTKVVQGLTKYLKKGGYFIMGLSESFTHKRPEYFELKRIENSVYQKC
jgi:chemotaxis protein methyltransferase CheR